MLQPPHDSCGQHGDQDAKDVGIGQDTHSLSKEFIYSGFNEIGARHRPRRRKGGAESAGVVAVVGHRMVGVASVVAGLERRWAVVVEVVEVGLRRLGKVG